MASELDFNAKQLVIVFDGLSTNDSVTFDISHKQITSDEQNAKKLNLIQLWNLKKRRSSTLFYIGQMAPLNGIFQKIIFDISHVPEKNKKQMVKIDRYPFWDFFDR